MRIVLAAALALFALTSAAFAQANQVIDPDLLPENRAIDQQYRNALKRLPDQQESNDPWRTVRSSDQSDSKAKAHGKTKTN